MDPQSLFNEELTRGEKFRFDDRNKIAR